ncbi:hypothetical protein CH371_08995 [Leptospira wolffii]|uniref:Uncharacterized protein n=2 Tax=Leptospira wolffii TaxID=409998 RepID=A0A2M9ZD92_9LEPT|nr:hypothetical protein CH371_08995 [Leptospira wolffii]
MVFRLFMDQFASWNAYRLAFGFAAFSYLFYFLALPWALFAFLLLGFLCLLGGIFFPMEFDRAFRSGQSFLLGILSFIVSLFILLGYILVWKPISLLFPQGTEKGKN